MVHKVLFWTGFGLAVRFWQLGLEMRPFFTRDVLLSYPIYALVGGTFGSFLLGVDRKHSALLAERRETLLQKRRVRDEGLPVGELDESQKPAPRVA